MIFPSDITKEEVNQLPLQGYKGRIVVVDTIKGFANAIKEVEKASFLGFDTETKPAFRKGVYHRVALLQLALTERVFLIRFHLR